MSFSSWRVDPSNLEVCIDDDCSKRHRCLSETLDTEQHIRAFGVRSPRTTPVARRMVLVAGQALDLRTGWDLRLPRHEEAALLYLRKVRPKLVIGSPGCTVNSLCGSDWDRHRRDRLEEAQNHMRFIVEVYWEQVNHGHCFLREHPVGATSWLMEEVKKLQSAEGYALQSQINASMV